MEILKEEEKEESKENRRQAAGGDSESGSASEVADHGSPRLEKEIPKMVDAVTVPAAGERLDDASEEAAIVAAEDDYSEDSSRRGDLLESSSQDAEEIMEDDHGHQQGARGNVPDDIGVSARGRQAGGSSCLIGMAFLDVGALVRHSAKNRYNAKVLRV